MNAQITVIIPTYNRPDCISYLLENSLNQYQGELFAFQIHDSSDDEKTKELLKPYLSERVQYFRYPASINGDVKTMLAIDGTESEFVYLLGDGLSVDFNALEQFLLKSDFHQVLVIGFRDFRGIAKKYIDAEVGAPVYEDDVVAYFQKYFWMLTLYGSTIVKGDVLKKAFQLSERYQKMKSPFMYVCSLFEALFREQGVNLFAFVDFVEVNPHKKQSGWFGERRAVEFFCYRYYASVLLLPKEYGASEREFLTMHNRCSQLFSFKGILRLRQSGNLTLRMVRDYRFYMKETVSNMTPVYLSLLIPRFVLTWGKSLYHVVKKR